MLMMYDLNAMMHTMKYETSKLYNDIDDIVVYYHIIALDKAICVELSEYEHTYSEDLAFITVDDFTIKYREEEYDKNLHHIYDVYVQLVDEDVRCSL